MNKSLRIILCGILLLSASACFNRDKTLPSETAIHSAQYVAILASINQVLIGLLFAEGDILTNAVTGAAVGAVVGAAVGGGIMSWSASKMKKEYGEENYKAIEKIVFCEFDKAMEITQRVEKESENLKFQVYAVEIQAFIAWLEEDIEQTNLLFKKIVSMDTEPPFRPTGDQGLLEAKKLIISLREYNKVPLLAPKYVISIRRTTMVFLFRRRRVVNHFKRMEAIYD